MQAARKTPSEDAARLNNRTGRPLQRKRKRHGATQHLLDANVKETAMAYRFTGTNGGDTIDLSGLTMAMGGSEDDYQAFSYRVKYLVPAPRHPSTCDVGQLAFALMHSRDSVHQREVA